MITEIFIAIILGCLAGIITGLTPGVHINLVAVLVLSLSTYLLKITSPLVIATFIISMSIVHTFLDAIPSIFLGAPESEMALSVLPGHKMLLQGRGYEAVMLTLIGSFFSLIFTIIFSPVLGFFIYYSYSFLENWIGVILILASILLILREKKGRTWALIIFLLSGILGIITLNLPGLKNPLFPLLSGLFGISNLIISLNEKTNIPKQKISFPVLKKKEVSRTIFSSVSAGTLCSFLPGLGPAQAAIVGSQFYKKITSEYFLVLVGGLNTVNMLISFLALYLIDKARNGGVVTISKLMGEITLNNLILFFGVSLVVGFIGVFLTIKLSKSFSLLLSKVNYQKLVLFVIFFVTVLVFILSSNFMGLVILIVSSFIGIIPARLGIGRNHLMGCLLLPVILYFTL